MVSAPGTAELVEAACRPPGPGEVRIRVAVAGICGTDRRLAARGADPPRIPGHEAAGHLDDGTPVGIHPDVGCGRCPHCLAGLENRCPDKRSVGLDRDGGLAEWLCVPAAHAVPVAGLDLRLVPLLEPLACCLHALSTLAVRRGDTALVVGAGAWGCCACGRSRPPGRPSPWPSAPRAAGAGGQARGRCRPRPRPGPAGRAGRGAVGRRRRRPRHRAAGLGARQGGRRRPGARLREHAGRGAGDANVVHYGHLTVIGSTGSTVGDYRRARDLAASGEVPLARLPRSTVPLEQAPAVLLGRDGHSALKITVDVEGTSQ